MDNYELMESIGLEFDANGPDVCDCPYCGKPLQYIADHSCFGICCEDREAAYGGFGELDE